MAPSTAADVNLVHRTDSVDDAYDWLIRQLTEQRARKAGRDALGRTWICIKAPWARPL